MRFWDSSAITPLLVDEVDSERRERSLRKDGDMLVWYGTLAEIESALCRKLRESPTAEAGIDLARARLSLLTRAWTEVEPTDTVRARAIRILRVHPLRAADALQLAAALVICRERTVGNYFFTGDLRLQTAAKIEGFEVD